MERWWNSFILVWLICLYGKEYEVCRGFQWIGLGLASRNHPNKRFKKMLKKMAIHTKIER